MINVIRYLIPLFIFLLLVVLFVFGLQYDPRRVPSPLIDKPVPQFELPRLKDPQLTLGSADLKGDVVLVNVWASWCPSCVHEHPVLLELSKRGEVKLIGLNYKDKRENALDWLNNYGDPYTMNAFDEQGRVGIDFGVYGAPETYIVDQNGIIRYKHIGPISREDLDNKILPIVRELKVAPREIKS